MKKKDGPRQSRIPGGAATDRRITGADLRVLGLLGRHTDEGGWCVRSQSTMAEQLGSSRGSVGKSIARLKELGYLQVKDVFDDRGARRASHYRLVEPEAQAELFVPGAHHDSAERQAPDSSARQAPTPHGESGPDSAVESAVTTRVNDDSERGFSARARGRRRRIEHDPARQRELPVMEAVAGAQTRPAALTPIEGGWRPSDIDRAYAVQAGLSAAEIEREASRFRDWHEARDSRRASWAAEWRLWVGRAVDQRSPAAPVAGGDVMQPTEAQWRQSVAAWRKGCDRYGSDQLRWPEHLKWPTRWLGPPPDDPACLAPGHLLEELLGDRRATGGGAR